jgi:hypothetical protein
MVMITTGVFAGMDDAVVRLNLAAAQQALIDLQTGKSIVSMSYAQGDGSKSVTRKMGSVAECTALIAQLQSALGLARGRRPFRFVRT